MEEEVEESELIVRGNRAASTIKQYQSKIKSIIAVLKTHHPDGVQPDDTLVLPMTITSAKKMSSHIFKHADGTPKSVSEISNYFSAVKYGHEIKWTPR
jgi:hypothetical protein